MNRVSAQQALGFLMRSVGRAANFCVSRVRAFPGHEGGASAIEFGLIAPMLFFSLLAMTDVGFALHDRMTMDHVLRAGAQTAMQNAGEPAILSMLEATASQNYTAADNIAFDVDHFSVCPSTGERLATFTSPCPEIPTVFYELNATKSYEGIFLPSMNFAPSVLVQVR